MQSQHALLLKLFEVTSDFVQRAYTHISSLRIPLRCEFSEVIHGLILASWPPIMEYNDW